MTDSTKLKNITRRGEGESMRSGGPVKKNGSDYKHKLVSISYLKDK